MVGHDLSENVSTLVAFDEDLPSWQDILAMHKLLVKRARFCSNSGKHSLKLSNCTPKIYLPHRVSTIFPTPPPSTERPLNCIFQMGPIGTVSPRPSPGPGSNVPARASH